MANILLLDESDVARSAMRGIVARGKHGFCGVKEWSEAWRTLREGVAFDLVFLDLKLAGGTAYTFLEAVRRDWFFKTMPVVVYTSDTSVAQVRRALGMKIQNYLVKPYDDELIHTEIAKAVQDPWRSRYFEEAKAFCATSGLTLTALAEMRRGVMTSFEEAARTFPAWAEERNNEDVIARITTLAAAAEAAGIWGGVDFLRHLHHEALVGNWASFAAAGDMLEFASRLVFCQLNPSFEPDGVRAVATERREQRDTIGWATADAERSGPVIDPAVLTKQVEALSGCPVVDTTAAAFLMMGEARGASMERVMDLVATDPGLSAQVLSHANRTTDESGDLEDARAAASRLGDLKLHSIAQALPVIREREMDVAPFNWPGYWTFLVATGRTAQFIAGYLDFEYLKGSAYTAGLLHDLGRLLVWRLHPAAMPAIMRHAWDRKIALGDAERRYLGCSTRELGAKFAERQTLPRVYTNVIRWVDTPALATEHMDLIAIVAVARHICVQLKMGTSGEPLRGAVGSLASTPEWSVLQGRLFPSFDLRKFEAQAHAFCLTLRNELSGKRSDARLTHAQRAAELV